ncbi:F-box family protein [Dorcoceras hygrometricum]|uniref:F-box family protein n=1 Tax=Dorcoceras hygrometricum TaxID=472368 RepID=A0A2Z7CYL5_9LAMI|nr:F-box family protein [Dorcoceras hygrometricum]
MPRITRRRRQSSEEIRRIVSRIETLPHELVGEVLARVAASSVTDIINAKLSCKTFKEIGEDSHVYHHMSLDKLFTDSWTPLRKEQQVFLNKCWKSENPDLLYRKAILDYFHRADVGSACKCLLKAVDARHVGALYLACIMLILTDDDKFKEKGIEMISNMQKSTWLRGKLTLYRKTLMVCLRRMWVLNPILNRRLVFCQTRHQNHWRSGWRDMDEELQCQACCVDREFTAICGSV